MLLANVQDWLTAIGALIGGAGGLGGLALLGLIRLRYKVDTNKLHTEMESISVQAAEGAVGIQGNIISAQKGEIERLQGELQATNTRLDNITLRWASTEDENRRLRSTIEELRTQVVRLQDEVAALKQVNRRLNR